jgi:hypothetical protein
VRDGGHTNLPGTTRLGTLHVPAHHPPQLIGGVVVAACMSGRPLQLAQAFHSCACTCCPPVTAIAAPPLASERCVGSVCGIQRCQLASRLQVCCFSPHCQVCRTSGPASLLCQLSGFHTCLVVVNGLAVLYSIPTFHTGGCAEYDVAQAPGTSPSRPSSSCQE